MVKDRNVPVARIVPWHSEHESDLVDLAGAGLLRLGDGQIDDSFWLMDAPHVSMETLEEIMESERGDI